MAYVINDSCIQCGSCAGQCPVGAISEGDGKSETMQIHVSAVVPAQADAP